MFDIGWSELVVIAVVALIAIGPKELPGVLRMVGQWMGKARKMASEFQGQFQEAMREAEMADIKKSFDEVKEAATGLTSGNIMTSLQKDVGDALRIDDIDKPVTDKPADRQARGRADRFRNRRTGYANRRTGYAGRADAGNLRRGRGAYGGIRAAGDHARGFARAAGYHASGCSRRHAAAPDVLKDAKAS